MYSTPINAQTVVASGTFTSYGQSLSHAVSGFSLYYEITGDGTVDFFYYVSVDGENFVKEDRAIKRGLTKTSGSGGKGILYIPIMPCNAVKIEVVETGGANSVVVTAQLASRIGRFGDTPVYDGMSSAITTISYPHHEAHGASRFFRTYSILSLGAMETPDDMVTLTWTTPDTTKWEHFTFYVIGTGGWRVRFIEGSTGGGENATGVLEMFNHQRNSTKPSTCIDLASGAGNVSYDATLLTGGESLIDEWIPGGNKLTGAVSGDRDEIILGQNQTYQLSCYGTDTDVCTMHIDWYEHTNR